LFFENIRNFNANLHSKHGCLQIIKLLNWTVISNYLHLVAWHCVLIRSLAPPCASASRRLELIGRLKSHGVWVCVTGDQQLVLFHLVRAQEQMLFARMMASHVLPTENLQQPVKLDVRQVFLFVMLLLFYV